MNGTPLLAVATFYWHLPVVIILISLVYSATRHDDWGAIFAEAWRWGLRMAAFLAGIAVILFVMALWGWGARLLAFVVGLAAVASVLTLWNWGQRIAASVVGIAAVIAVLVLWF